jgi:UPF0716 protein FxsA
VLPLLVVLFVAMPLLELAVIIQVGHAIGALNTIGLLLAVGVAGGWLVKREGVGVARRLQRTVAAGRVPTTELLDGFLVLLAGALLLAPGFVSDVFAIALLLPPVRAVLRLVVVRRFAGGPGRPVRPGRADPLGPGDIIDID